MYERVQRLHERHPVGGPCLAEELPDLLDLRPPLVDEVLLDDLERCGHLGPGRGDGRPERLRVLPQQHEDRDQGSDRRHDKADGGQQERDRRTDALNRGHQASNRGNDRPEHLHADESGHQQVHKLGRLRELVDHRNQELVNELRNIGGHLLDRARKARPHRRHKRPQSIQETHQDRP